MPTSVTLSRWVLPQEIFHQKSHFFNNVSSSELWIFFYSFVSSGSQFKWTKGNFFFDKKKPIEIWIDHSKLFFIPGLQKWRLAQRIHHWRTVRGRLRRNWGIHLLPLQGKTMQFSAHDFVESIHALFSDYWCLKFMVTSDFVTLVVGVSLRKMTVFVIRTNHSNWA